MAETLSQGITIPQGTDQISTSGVEEMRTVGRTTNTALEGMAADIAKKMNVEATELTAPTDLNDVTVPGVYYESRSADAAAGANFPEPVAGALTVTSNVAREHVHQVYITFGSANPRQWYRSRYNDTWSPWKQLVTEERLAEALGGLATLDAVELGSMDLDTVKDAGSYSQSFSAQATTALHYPATRAGRLLVQANAEGTQVTQQYITFDTTTNVRYYVRNFYLEWSEWWELPLGGGGTGGGFSTTELDATDLDTVTTAGTYSQSFSASATTALHYPVARAGRLLVLSNESKSQVTQFYITFDATSNIRYYVRNYYQSWGSWWQIPLSGAQPEGDNVYRGIIPDGTDINTIREEGIYSVPTVAVASTLVNWPTNRAGTLQVWHNDEASVTTQDVIAMVSTTSPAERYYRATISSLNTSWGPWSNQDWIKSTLNGASDARVNVDTYRIPGAWAITSRTYVDGLPGTGTGILEVVTSPKYAMGLQRFTERVANDEVRVWHRYSLLVGGWAGIAWDELSGGSTGPSNTNVADVETSDHATRVEYARSRRGGGTGTGGLPVFMWRFDHWLVAFRDKILPILQEFDLPATLNVNYDNLSNEQNGGGSITWAHVQDWNQYSGIEIANHGSTHTNVNTMASIYHEIVEGRRNLETAMPLVAVETWQEHGSAYLVATDLPGDTGLDLGRSLEAFTESYAGRLVMAEHAVVEGKIGSFYPPLSGHPQIGQSHYSLDRDTASSAISTIQYAQKLGRGLTGYTHPGLMDQVNEGGSLYPATYNADGSVDYQGTAASPTHYATEAEFRSAMETAGHIVHMPTKDFRAICEWLAAERDAGRIMVMTAAGGAFADKSHNRRENLLVSPDFSDTSVWGGSGGYTITGTGDAVTATSGAGAAPMTQGMLLYTRFGWAMGAAHELLVHVRASSATTLTLGMEKLGDPATWKTEKTYEVPGDGVVRPYRLNLTLPRSNDITQMTVRLGGPNLTIVGQPLLAAI